MNRKLKWFLIVLIVILIPLNIFYKAYKIPSDSMVPNLLVGDHIYINKRSYMFGEISRGDLILFNFPKAQNKYVGEGVIYFKRVIGISGDKIDIKGRNIYLNGKAIQQKYVDKYLYGSVPKEDDLYIETFPSGKSFNVIYRQGSDSMSTGNVDFPITVPEGSLFVMGDNRDNSYDSRFWGNVPIENVIGKAVIIYLSIDSDNPELFEKIRWNRTFLPLY